MKFTTPVSMKVTQEQFEKDLKSQLESLGYYYDDEFVWGLLSQYLITYIEDDDNSFFFNQDENGDDCYYIDHYNPELFLALAAMNNGDDPIVGEWMYVISDKRHEYFNVGDLFKITEINSRIYLYFDTCKSVSRYRTRKATKEEIINHFSFKVPEKWCIRPNEGQALEVFRYFKGKNKDFVGDGSDAHDYCWYCSPERSSKYHALLRGKASDYNSEEITFEQFKKYILKQETMKEQKIHHVTRKQLAEIYNIACVEWKEKISKITQDTLGSFAENGYLDDRIVQEMFKAATSEQKPTLEKIFGIQDKNAFVREFETCRLNELSRELFGNTNCLMIANRSAIDVGRNDLIGRSLVIGSNYNVTFHSDGDITLLEITQK